MIIYFKPDKLLPLYEFGLNTYVFAKYYFNPYQSNEWVHCERIEDTWIYLRNEKVQKISFCNFETEKPPDKWRTWGEVNEPEKTEDILKLIQAGKIEGYTGVLCWGRMKIVTDKHKFIIPIEWDNNKVYSYRRESRDLRKRLWKWGFPGDSEKYFALKEAEKKENYYPMEIDNAVGRIVFITREQNYWKQK